MNQRQHQQLQRRKYLANLEHRLLHSEHRLMLLTRDQHGTLHLTPLGITPTSTRRNRKP
jgi:hypothetical protein